MIVQEEPWVDMSEFEDDDPEGAISDADLDRLRGALAVDPTEEPSDAVWEHMLSTALGGVPESVPDEPDVEGEVDPVGEEPVDDPLATHPTTWDVAPADDATPDHDVWYDPQTGHDHHEDGP